MYSVNYLQALNFLLYIKVGSVLTQWLNSNRRENTKFSNNIYLPWPYKFTTILQLKEIPIQEWSMSNLRPLMQKSVIYRTTTHYISKGY